jgi:polyvinyl alcohol dehydrogenase (cytochrome)
VSIAAAGASLVALASLGGASLQGCKSTAGTGVPDAAASAAALDCETDSGDWPMYGHDICNTRAAAFPGDAGLAGVVADAGITTKWMFTAAGDISATPAVVAGQVYFPDWGGMLHRVDAQTGQAVWSRAVADILGADGDAGDAEVLDAAPPPQGGGSNALGISYSASSILAARVTPVVTGGLVIFGVANPGYPFMVAVDQDTGALKWLTRLDSHPYALITSSPALDGNVVYVGVSSGEEGAILNDPTYDCCTFRGSVAALNATTGAVLWQTPTIDDDVYFAADGGLTGYAGSPVWSGTPTVDHKRNALYVTTGNNYSTPPEPGDAGAPPLPTGDRIESVIALDLTTGAIRWSQRMTTGDVWNFALLNNHDYDLGCGANFFQAEIGGVYHDVIGAGQKSGVYWAIDADTGMTLWKTQVGPGGHLGGLHWGAAVDGTRIYAGVNDEFGISYTLGGRGPMEAGTSTKVGSWAALDPASGETIWQTPNPAMSAPLNGASVNGPVAVVGGVLFAGSMDQDGMMYAFDAATGALLWQFKSGGTVYSGPAIVGNVVYWGNGYPSGRLGFGTPGGTLYAFQIGPGN